jgi:hypothetical protein
MSRFKPEDPYAFSISDKDLTDCNQRRGKMPLPYRPLLPAIGPLSLHREPAKRQERRVLENRE